MSTETYTDTTFYNCTKLCINIVNMMYTNKHFNKQITAFTAQIKCFHSSSGKTLHT